MDREWIEQANAALDTWGHHPSIERVTSYTGGIQLELFSDISLEDPSCSPLLKGEVNFAIFLCILSRFGVSFDA